MGALKTDKNGTLASVLINKWAYELDRRLPLIGTKPQRFQLLKSSAAAPQND
jgi:hypothetical protein